MKAAQIRLHQSRQSAGDPIVKLPGDMMVPYPHPLCPNLNMKLKYQHCLDLARLFHPLPGGGARI